MKQIYFNPDNGCFLRLNCSNITEKFLSLQTEGFEKEDIEFIFGIEPLPDGIDNLFIQDVLKDPLSALNNIFDEINDDKIYVIENEYYNLIARNDNASLYLDDKQRLSFCEHISTRKDKKWMDG